MLDQRPSQLPLLLAGSVGTEELEHSCEIMSRDFFSISAKLEHKNQTFRSRLSVHCLHAENRCTDILQIRATFSYRTGVKLLLLT